MSLFRYVALANIFLVCRSFSCHSLLFRYQRIQQASNPGAIYSVSTLRDCHLYKFSLWETRGPK